MCWAQVRLIPDFLSQEHTLRATIAPSPPGIMLIYIFEYLVRILGPIGEDLTPQIGGGLRRLNMDY